MPSHPRRAPRTEEDLEEGWLYGRLQSLHAEPQLHGRRLDSVRLSAPCVLSRYAEIKYLIGANPFAPKRTDGVG
jgi:hypothetical protein